MDRRLLRHDVPERHRIVIGPCLHHERSFARPAFLQLQAKGIVVVANDTGLAGQEPVRLIGCGRGGIDDADVGPQRGLPLEIQAERRLVEEWFALKRYRVDKLGTWRSGLAGRNGPEGDRQAAVWRGEDGGITLWSRGARLSGRAHGHEAWRRTDEGPKRSFVTRQDAHGQERGGKPVRGSRHRGPYRFCVVDGLDLSWYGRRFHSK